MNTKKSYLLALILGLSSFLLHKGVFRVASAFSPAFRLQTLDISGQKLVSDLSFFETFMGRPLRALNLIQIREGLLEHPLIADAVLRKQYPSTLQVSLIERVPVAEVHSGTAVYVADASARALPLRPAGNIPQIYADFGLALNGPQMIDENIGAALAAAGSPWAKNLAALSLSRDKGVSFTLKNLQTSFYVGAQPITETHLERASRIASDIAQKRSRIPKTVDLSGSGDTVVGYF